ARQDDPDGHARSEGRRGGASDGSSRKRRSRRLNQVGCAPVGIGFHRAMYVVLLVLKNALRHKLRTILTVLGIVVAITAFGLLRTIVDAWYAGANASSSARLITRNAVSLVFSMPVTYAQKIRQVPGVASVAMANWF